MEAHPIDQTGTHHILDPTAQEQMQVYTIKHIVKLLMIDQYPI